VGKLIDIGEIKSNGKSTYEIEMHVGGKEIDVLFDAQGKEIGRSEEGDVAAPMKQKQEAAGEDDDDEADHGDDEDEDDDEADADDDEDEGDAMDDDDDDDDDAEGDEDEGDADGHKLAAADFQHEFDLQHRELSTTGRNRYFILEPGYQLVLAGKDGQHDAELEIIVLDETREIGGIPTRVVEEREKVDGKLVEISRNYFAICKQTNSVFYFGEDVDIYRDGKVVDHEGAWLHGKDNAQAGLMMPGECIVGAAYYQEYAPQQAMDRARIQDLGVTFKTPAGEFGNCLKVWEENPLDGDSETKTFAPGIGLVQDEGLLLVKHGFVNK
jgi:hypothetical protein